MLYAILSIAAFLIYGFDKLQARKRRWRVPEPFLLGIAGIGGAPGAFLAMELFHHKTRHMNFRILVPLFILIHAGLIFYFGYLR